MCVHLFFSESLAEYHFSGALNVRFHICIPISYIIPDFICVSFTIFLLHTFQVLNLTFFAFFAWRCKGVDLESFAFNSSQSATRNKNL